MAVSQSAGHVRWLPRVSVAGENARTTRRIKFVKVAIINRFLILTPRRILSASRFTEMTEWNGETILKISSSQKIFFHSPIPISTFKYKDAFYERAEKG